MIEASSELSVGRYDAKEESNTVLEGSISLAIGPYS